jgi:hypothetical protein
MVYLLALAVCVLPIQRWTDALPKVPGGLNFQHLLTAPMLMPGSVTSHTGVEDDSAQGRLEYWKWAAVAGTVRYPLGVGYQCYVPKHREETGIKLDTHNFFMRTLAEMGIIGPVLVLRIFWKAFRTTWRLVDAAHTPFGRALGTGVAIMWLGSFVANLFGDRVAYISLNCYIWGFTGLALAELHRADALTARLAAEEAEAADEDAEPGRAAPYVSYPCR